jgi:hypothetical protein
MSVYAIHLDWKASGTLDVEIDAETEEEALELASDIQVDLSDRCGHSDDRFDVGWEDVTQIRIGGD